MRQICRNILRRWIVRLNRDQFELRSENVAKLVVSCYTDVTRNRECYYKFICIYSIRSSSYPNNFHKNSIFIIASPKFKFWHETISLFTQSKDSKLFQSRISDHREKKHLHLSTGSKLSFLLSNKNPSEGFSMFRIYSHRQRDNYSKQLER